MIPILYEKTETSFLTEGLGRLTDAISCTVTEERNGLFELEMEYPAEGLHFEALEPERIICAIPAPGKKMQPFRIYRIERLLRTARVYGRHVCYQLHGIPVAPFTASSAAAAFEAIKQNAASPCPFTFTVAADYVNEAGTLTLEEPRSAMGVLGGQEGSILDIWGGEYEYDGFNVILHRNRGEDRGVHIRYGRNLLDVDADTSAENRYTGVYCYFRRTEYEEDPDTGETVETDVLVLPSGVYDTGAETADTVKRVQIVDVTTEYDSDEAAPTPQALYQRARQYAEENSVSDLYSNIEVDFLDLSATTEYENTAELERVYLCDDVWVHYVGIGIRSQLQVIETVCNVLSARYRTITIGTAAGGIYETLNNMMGRG